MVNSVNSYVVDLKHGIVQGWIMGLILYALYVALLFDLTDKTNFDDNNFAIEWSDTILELIESRQIKLERIIKWLKDSGLIVNESLM